jgi:putative ATP-binding cassette transporter
MGPAHTLTFEVGPITLDIERGSVVFITGGNGSGKSTLAKAKILSQHFAPTSGGMWMDETAINAATITGVRNEVSCIYSDYYLFDTVLNTKSTSAPFVEKVEFYLKEFGLSDKVRFVNGHFSTVKLSDGQRRRLALVVAIVEEKSIYVFDEWAADQDPQFKRTFYYDILPFLKGRNCAVVVVTHDDRYFGAADRTVHMERGRIVDVHLQTGDT